MSMRDDGPSNFGVQPTPQQKLISVANMFGNTGLKKMQGSSFIVYDFLPLTEGLNAQNKMTFFKNVNTRQFPFTNLTENKLQVGEGFVLERMYLMIMSILTATQEVTNVQTFDTFATPGLYKSDFEIRQANNIVVKQSPLTSMKPEFNRAADFATDNVFYFDTDISFQPLLQFEMDLLTPKITIPTSETLDFYIGVAWEGAGAILNPRANF